jgi:hypothetical protein
METKFLSRLERVKGKTLSKIGSGSWVRLARISGLAGLSWVRAKPIPGLG